MKFYSKRWSQRVSSFLGEAHRCRAYFMYLMCFSLCLFHCKKTDWPVALLPSLHSIHCMQYENFVLWMNNHCCGQTGTCKSLLPDVVAPEVTGTASALKCKCSYVAEVSNNTNCEMNLSSHHTWISHGGRLITWRTLPNHRPVKIGGWVLAQKWEPTWGNMVIQWLHSI